MKRKKDLQWLKAYFKKWEVRLKKAKLKEKNKSTFLVAILIIGAILMMASSVLYLKSVFEKESLELRKELEKIRLKNDKNNGSVLLETPEPTSPETLFRLRETGIERYFLSEVKLIDIYYTPVIHACLLEEGRPIHPFYIYETWSMVDYPQKPPPEIALIRYLLLPEDNPDFQPDKACYIKEIKTDEDWQEVEEEYGFSRRQF